MEYVVYKHTSPSGKCYVGITCQKPERRWRNGEGYVECTAFYNAIRKYGWENFTHEILKNHLTFEQACEEEKYYIEFFGSLTTQNGYNLENGGRVNQTVSLETRNKISNSLRGRKRPPMTLEQRKRISESHKGKKMPPRSKETCEKLSEALTGRTFSEEHKKHISESKKGTQAGKNNPRARKVLCMELDIVFDTIKEAGEFVHCSPKNIVSCCRGRLNRSGGYHWTYVLEEV